MRAGERFSALSSYLDIAGMGQYSSEMWLSFTVQEDGSAVHTWQYGSTTLPREQVELLFNRGRCMGLGCNTTLSQPVIG